MFEYAWLGAYWPRRLSPTSLYSINLWQCHCVWRRHWWLSKSPYIWLKSIERHWNTTTGLGFGENVFKFQKCRPSWITRQDYQFSGSSANAVQHWYSPCEPNNRLVVVRVKSSEMLCLNVVFGAHYVVLVPDYGKSIAPNGIQFV